MFFATLPAEPPAVHLYVVEPQKPPIQTVDFSPFTRGALALDLTASYTRPIFESQARFITGSFGISYAFLEHFTISIEGTGDYRYESGVYGGGGGFDLRARLELCRWHDISLFADGSLGLIESDHPVPLDGTHFNFCESAGLGVMIPIVPPHVYLVGGLRFQHISNAGISVDPGHEGMQGYAGIMVPL